MNKRKTSLGDGNVVTTVKPVTYSVTDMNKTKTPLGDGNGVSGTVGSTGSKGCM